MSETELDTPPDPVAGSLDEDDRLKPGFVNKVMSLVEAGDAE
ncbi:MAG: hypothetical protein JWN59_1596, partial [Sphingomonas bacterium]|nr:hypothetical protein [Sphingomonas bacterium]